MTSQSVRGGLREPGRSAAGGRRVPRGQRAGERPPALPTGVMPSLPKDGEAQALVARLEHAAAHSDFHAARPLVEHLLATRPIADQISPEARVRLYLVAIETATLGGDPHRSLCAQRLALAQLQALALDSECRLRAELRVLELQAERARFYGDASSHFSAVKQAAHFLLRHRFRLPASCRYAVVWEIVELFSACGLRAAAHQLGRRMADLAATELGSDAPVESLILAHEALFDLPGFMTRALGLSLPRIAASDAVFPQGRVIQQKFDELEDLTRQAERIDLGHWAGGWSYRAQRSKAILSWALGGGSARNLLVTMHRGIEHTQSAGLYARQPERERFVQLAQLAADGAAGKLRQHPDQRIFGGAEGDYLAAAQHALAGRSSEALAAYARYARASHQCAMVGQQALAADLLAIGEVLVALPRRLAPPPVGQDPMRVVCRSARLFMEQGPSTPLSQIAMEQGLTARRLQQAFKAVGLERPSQFLRRIRGGAVSTDLQ